MAEKKESLNLNGSSQQFLRDFQELLSDVKLVKYQVGKQDVILDEVGECVPKLQAHLEVSEQHEKDIQKQIDNNANWIRGILLMLFTVALGVLFL